MRRRLAALALVAAVAGTYPLFATAEIGFQREPNSDRSGNDILVRPLPPGSDVAVCEALCAATKGCVAYTYVKQSTTVPRPVCRIKDQAPFGHESSCCISGTRKQ